MIGFEGVGVACNKIACESQVASYRLYRCSLLIEMLMLVEHRLCRCSVVIKMLLLVNYRLCRVA